MLLMGWITLYLTRYLRYTCNVLYKLTMDYFNIGRYYLIFVINNRLTIQFNTGLHYETRSTRSMLNLSVSSNRPTCLTKLSPLCSYHNNLWKYIPGHLYETLKLDQEEINKIIKFLNIKFVIYYYHIIQISMKSVNTNKHHSCMRFSE